MKRTPSDKQRICGQFDSFIKRCLTRAMFNYENKRKRMSENEKPVEDINLLFEEEAADSTEIPDFIIEGLKITIKSEKLFLGLKSIKDSERDIVLLIHFLDRRVADVAKEKDVSEQTIYNWYNKAIDKIRAHMEDNE